MTFSGGSNGDAGPGLEGRIADMIAALTDDIAALVEVPDTDRRHLDVARVLAAKRCLVGYLHRYLPPVDAAAEAVTAHGGHS
jgi:hypothetical protein